MAELKCPHCGQAFTVDDAELSSIISQIRDKEFNKDLEKRIEELEENMAEKHKLELELVPVLELAQAEALVAVAAVVLAPDRAEVVAAVPDLVLDLAEDQVLAYHRLDEPVHQGHQLERHNPHHWLRLRHSHC